MGAVKSIGLEFPATLLAMGIALAATPVLAQGAMTPRPDVAPRVAPAAPAPQAPVVVPQAPVMAPQVPVVTPLPSALPSGPTGPGKTQAGTSDGSTTRLGGTASGAGPAPAGLRGGFIIPLIAVVALQGPGGASVGTGKTDNMGQIAFQNLPAGRYTARLQGKDLPAGTTGPVAVVATVNGKETARTTFDVPAGGAGSRSFDLPFDVGPAPAGIKGSTAIVALLAAR